MEEWVGKANEARGRAPAMRVARFLHMPALLAGWHLHMAQAVGILLLEVPKSTSFLNPCTAMPRLLQCTCWPCAARSPASEAGCSMAPHAARALKGVGSYWPNR